MNMVRADILLASKKLAGSRTAAAVLIREGRVTVNGTAIQKPSALVPDDADVSVNYPSEQYVSRGGYKLSAALDGFGVDPSGRVCLDIGASTGGFTDCLLRHGAEKVYAIDSGTLQLDETLKSDSRVISRENTNARYLSPDDFTDKITLITVDVSFISQALIYKAASDVIADGGEMIALIKPQFELDKASLGKNGILHDPKGLYFEKIKLKLSEAAREYGFEMLGTMDSPIKGGSGNREYLAYFRKEATD